MAVDASDRGRESIRKPGSRQIGSTASFPEKYGEKLIPAMVRAIDGEKLPEAFYTDHVFLTKDNVDQYYPNDPGAKKGLRFAPVRGHFAIGAGASANRRLSTQIRRSPAVGADLVPCQTSAQPIGRLIDGQLSRHRMQPPISTAEQSRHVH